MFKILHCFLLFLCLRFCRERAEISSFARSWIFLSRIQAILPRFEFSDHNPVHIFADELDSARWNEREPRKLWKFPN